ncbi:mitochondrial antiviral-signaling protein [Hypanus sabinus]|uniref:mitochondrial antiviral-signaling protein n=1 Tax=Hypanus sabinus TaxID=79690 RepID=UPI0028C3BC6B|nr:mitochondrial antiviral-signaling protein [Hypanus sabinus]
MSYASAELYKYVKERMPSFLPVNVTELLPYLSCLTQMDQERIRAQVRLEGNESAVPIFLDSVRRRRNWERQLINALRMCDYHELADGLETKLESLAPRRRSASGGTSAPFPAPATPYDSSSTDFVSPPRPQSSASLPAVFVGDNQQSTSSIAQTAIQLQPAVHDRHLASDTPVPSALVPQSVPGTPISNVPAAYSTPVTQPVPCTPLSDIPSVYSTPAPGTPNSNPASVYSTPVPQSGLGTPMVKDSMQPPTVPQSALDTQAPHTPAQGTSMPHIVPGTSSPILPVEQSMSSTTAPGPHVPCLTDLPAAISSSSGESSSPPLVPSDTSLQGNSIECKVPVQEIGNPLDGEESKDHRLPVQDRSVLDRSKQSDFPQSQQNQTKQYPQGNLGEKCHGYAANRAKGGTISDETNVIVPPPCIQVHPSRPSAEPVVDKPGVLRSDVWNMESTAESSCDFPETSCTITSSDLQYSESTTSDTENNGLDRPASPNSYPVSTPEHGGISDDFGDKNSIKEQKIQALQGYQNDQLLENFYDINNPLNIQMNFDAQKKIAALNEGASLDEEGILNHTYNAKVPLQNKPNPVSSTEVIQSPVLTVSHPVDGADDCKLDFEGNVPDSSCVSISESELMISSESSDGSFENSLGITDSESSVHVPAWSDDADVLAQNQALQQEYKVERGEVRFTDVVSSKGSSQKVEVAKGGDSFHTHCEVGHDKPYSNTNGNYTLPYNEDVREYSGHIYQEPEHENEAGNDHGSEAGNLGGCIGRCLEKDMINALSDEHVPLPSQQRSQTKLPEKPTRDLRQPDYILVSSLVLVFTIVAGFVWKYCRK